MLTIRWLREQMRHGKSIFDLPLRVTFYARVSGAWEMMGEGEDEYHAVADAGRVESFRTELDGGWSEYAVGANFKLAPNAFVWADLEKIAGGDIRENYRYTISARRVW